MKKAILLGSVVLAASSQAAIVYDSLFTTSAQTTANTLTDTGSLPRTRKADIVQFAPLTGTDNSYRINNITFGLVNWGTTPFTGTLEVQIKLWQTSTPGAGTSTTTPTFTNQIVAGNLTYNIGTIFTGGLASNTVGFLGVNFTNTILFPTSLATPQLGVELSFTVNGLADNNLSPVLTRFATGSGTSFYAGSSTNGYYRDAAADGIIQQGDLRTIAGFDSQLGLSVNADAVPEPASMIAIGLGIAGLAAKRRRKNS